MVRRIIEGLGRSVATPDEARAFFRSKAATEWNFDDCGMPDDDTIKIPSLD